MHMYTLNYRRWLLLLSLTFLGLIPAFSQSVTLTPAGPTANGFMQGSFLEVGVASCGSYGTEGTAVVPAGYHPRGATPSGIGFVADIGRDGWTVGTPNYCGDYFLPGSPVEGWIVEVNTQNYINDSRCGTRNVTGSIISGTVATGGIPTVVWEGTIGTGAGSGLRIRQTTTFPNTALYFVTKVEFTNTTAAPMLNVYYVRNVDPDNDQPVSGSFTTRNVVVSQPSVTNCDALVTATGTGVGCFLGLGARTANARVSRGGFSTVAPARNYYLGAAGLRDTTTGRTVTSDEAISIAFYFPRIDPGQTVTAAFAYVLNSADLATALEATGGAFIFSDSADITPTLADTICPGDPVELLISSDTNYRWSWTPNYRITSTTGTRVTVNPDTTITYVATGINGPCGTIVRRITIYVDSNVNVNAGPDDTICLGQIATLRATNASFYTWSPGATLSDSNSYITSAFPTVTTQYKVSTNCGLDSMTLFVVPNFGINLRTDTAICWSDSIQLFANPVLPGSYTWNWTPSTNLSATNISNPWADIFAAQRYNVSILSSAGCQRDTFVNLSVRGYRPKVSVDGDTSPVCFGDTVTLSARVLAGTCSQYRVDTIAFAPVAGSGTSLALTDNQLSTGIPLGFNFDFFCQTYNTAYISSNGFITFDRTSGDGCCTGQLLPNVNRPNAVIAGAWQNLNPSFAGSSIDYRTIGTAPNRQFIVNFNDVAIQFTTPTTRVKFQIVLFENGSNVEIHTTYANFTFGGTQGIENDSGTIAFPAPGRNSAAWSATNSSRRWTRIAPPSYGYTWTPGTGLSSTTTQITNATVTNTRTYMVTVSDSGCTRDALFTVRLDTSLRITSLTNDTVVCALGSVVPISARVEWDSVPRVRNICDRYLVTSIPFAPLTGSGSAVTLSDDQLSSSLPIGFNFNFFCNNYTNFHISSNGFITFDPAAGSGCCSGQVLPNPTSPNNVIAAGWDDLYPPGRGSIQYRTTGVAPNRILVVDYNDIPLCCGTTSAFKSQILLFESTNIIEVHTTYANSLSPATCGIENATGTLGFAAPGRNGVAWPSAVRNESWRFAPDVTTTPGRTLTFSWTPTTGLTPSTSLNPFADPGVNTTYVLRVSDGVCEKVDSVKIFYGYPYTKSADTAICYGDTVNLFINGPSYGFTWTPPTGLSNPNISNPVATPTTNTLYRVSFTDSAGCSRTDSVLVIVHPLVPIDLVPNDTLLCGPDTIGYTALNGAFASYFWNTGDTTPSITSGVTGTFWVIGTDTFGCSNFSDTVNLRVITSTYTISNDTAICYGQSVNLGITGPMTNFNWVPTRWLSSSTIGNPVSTPDSSIMYYVNFTDTVNCPFNDSVFITVHPIITIDLRPDTSFFCRGDSIIFDAFYGAFRSYTWSTGSTNSAITVRNDGQYAVIAVDTFGCVSRSDTVGVDVIEFPVTNILPTPDSFCVGSSLIIGITAPTPPTTILWAPGGESTPTITVNTPGLYRVTQTNIICSTSDSINIYEKFPPVLNTLTDTTVCCPYTYSVDPGGAPASYLWSDGTTTRNYTFSSTSSVTVTVTSSNGCTATEDISVEFFCINPLATATPDTVFRGNPSQLNVTTDYVFPYNYSWIPSTGLSNDRIVNPVSTPTTTTEYLIIVTDTLHGCTDSATVTVNVRIPGFFAFPDAFTPNGDGTNDYYYPVISEGAEVLEFVVYNRWGQLVYSGTNKPGWDGRFGGVEQNSGTYTYFVRMKYPNKTNPDITEETLHQGSISLIR